MSDLSQLSPYRPDELLSSWWSRWHLDRVSRHRSAGARASLYRTWIEPYLGARPAAAISAADLRAWVHLLDQAVVADRIRWTTAVGIWAYLRAMLRDMCRSKREDLRVRDDDPSEHVAPPDRGLRREATFLYASEFLQLVSSPLVPLPRRRAYALAVYLYPRAGELDALRFSDLDLARGLVKVERTVAIGDDQEQPTKTGANRLFIGEPAVLPLLRQMHEERGGKGRVLGEWGRSAYAARLREDLRRAGVAREELFACTATRRPLTGHDLRATGITWRAIRGDGLADIAEAVGHRSLATTESYLRRGRALARVLGGEVFPSLEVLMGPAGTVGAGGRGACVACGKASGDRASCGQCRHRRNAKRRKLRRRRKKLGLCARCTQPAARGRRLCRRHLGDYVERQRERLEAGQCRSCKAPAARGRRHCQRHLEYYAERMRTRKARV